MNHSVTNNRRTTVRNASKTALLSMSVAIQKSFRNSANTNAKTIVIEKHLLLSTFLQCGCNLCRIGSKAAVHLSVAFCNAVGSAFMVATLPSSESNRGDMLNQLKRLPTPSTNVCPSIFCAARLAAFVSRAVGSPSLSLSSPEGTLTISDLFVLAIPIGPSIMSEFLDEPLPLERVLPEELPLDLLSWRCIVGCRGTTDVEGPDAFNDEIPAFLPHLLDFDCDADLDPEGSGLVRDDLSACSVCDALLLPLVLPCTSSDSAAGTVPSSSRAACSQSGGPEPSEDSLGVLSADVNDFTEVLRGASSAANRPPPSRGT
mmetsp:Transcript_1362/g.3658  ORF Transcript_1362/g.3658 Transcript_1362/m.3658 type:complete len:316 (+) Transcript_1362:2344-3291(+)